MKKIARLLPVILALAIAPLLAIPASASATSTPYTATAGFLPPGCAIDDNLDATAEDFIARCRIGRILREFPGEYLGATLAQIKVDRTTKGRKAWKLLTDGRFAKP
ncbi:hypothetical protein [Nonomuraea bangladeshensis]|uniref:hypothetical protein n=1 Tax=Nonomuraea bangladeshensis TaxID=404385 RepID=UPI003C303E5A